MREGSECQKKKKKKNMKGCVFFRKTGRLGGFFCNCTTSTLVAQNCWVWRICKIFDSFCDSHVQDLGSLLLYYSLKNSSMPHVRSASRLCAPAHSRYVGTLSTGFTFPRQQYPCAVERECFQQANVCCRLLFYQRLSATTPFFVLRLIPILSIAPTKLTNVPIRFFAPARCLSESIPGFLLHEKRMP